MGEPESAGVGYGPKPRGSRGEPKPPISRLPDADLTPVWALRGQVRSWVRRRPRPWAIDLFSGMGGLTLGLKQAGFSVLYAVDRDWLAVETYRVNHPEVVAEWSDIQDLDAADLRRRLGLRAGQLDLVAGCPPCQGFSRMRTLNGSRSVDDSRNDLIEDFRRFVEAFQPKVVMMENVPGLADDARFERFQSALDELGYRFSFQVLDAADFGVPQRRRRLILLAGKKRTIPFGREADRPRTVRNAIGALPPPGRSGDPSHDLAERRSDRIVELIRSIPRNGGSRHQAPDEFKLACHEDFDGFNDVYGRMGWEHQSPTITSGCVNPSKGRFLHPEQDRCITPREAALLQTFPEDYFISMRRGKYPAARLVGDALPPEFVRRHAEPAASLLSRGTNR